MQSYIQLASAVMAFAIEMMKGSSACGSWENCYMVGECMHIYKFCLNNFIKTVTFICNVCWLDEYSGCLDIRQDRSLLAAVLKFC
jgi:hypothetical protein